MDPPMSRFCDLCPQSKRRRRLIWLVVVLLCTAICTYLALRLRGPIGRELPRHRQAKDAAWAIEGLGGRVYWNPKTEVLETLYGAARVPPIPAASEKASLAQALRTLIKVNPRRLSLSSR